MALHWDAETHPMGPQRGWVIAMAAEAKQKAEGKEKKAKASAEAPAAAAPKAPPPPRRPPADPRLELLKKFQGKFLPQGVLRDRYNAVMERWDSGDDHGGVTVEGLKALLDDWKGTREKPPRLPNA
jgi:hypothetical protein